MRVLRWGLGCVLVIATAALCAACGGGGSSSSGSTEIGGGEGSGGSGVYKVEPKTIGVVAASLGAPIERASLEVLKQAGKEFGYEIKISDCNNEPEKMLAAANAFATEKVDAVVLASVEPTVVTPALNRLKASGTPVIGINGQQPPSPLMTASYVENEKELGAATAKLMVEQVPNAKIGALESSLFTGAERAAGLQEVLEGPEADGGEIVDGVEPDLASFVPSTTKGVTDMLTAHPEINTIYSVFDTFLEPTIAALRAKGSKAQVFSMYLEPVSYEMLKDPNSALAGVVNVDLGTTAAVAIDQLVGYFQNGDKIDPEAMSEHPLKLTAITRENLPKSLAEADPPSKILAPFQQEWKKEYGSA